MRRILSMIALGAGLAAAGFAASSSLGEGSIAGTTTTNPGSIPSVPPVPSVTGAETVTVTVTKTIVKTKVVRKKCVRSAKSVRCPSGKRRVGGKCVRR